MPTGYTYCIEQGATFKEYLMGCARAFGACITMRDEPSDARIPDEFKPGDYHPKEIQKCESELKKLESMTDKQVESASKKEFEKRLVEIDAVIKKERAISDRYAQIRKQAVEWTPPSIDHVGLKKFMLEQIDLCTSRNYESYYERERRALVIKSVDQWRKEKREKLLKDLSYHKKEYAEELERCAIRTDWIKKLKASI